MRAAEELGGPTRRLREQRPMATERLAEGFAWRYAVTTAPLAGASILLTLVPGPGPWALFATVAAFTQNALGLLMHEASHGFLHRNRRWNDRLADCLVCGPIFNTIDGYRQEHFAHHRLCCDEADPYHDLYGPYTRKADLYRGFILDLLGLTAVRKFARRSWRRDRPAAQQARSLVPLVCVQALLWLSLWLITGQLWAHLLLWLAPLATVPIALNRLRTFVEHHAGAGAEANRSTLPTRLEYVLIAPYGYAYHFEHHLLPEIPYFQLSWAHRTLADLGVTFGQERLAEQGYLRAFRRLAAELP